MISDEEAKLGQVAINAGEKVGGFIARYIGGPLEQGVGIFEDKLKYMRWERQVRLMKKADEFLKEVGLPKPNRQIAMKFAIPLIQSASLEDDDELQDRWGALLVNAGNKDSGIEIHRSYISVLEQITHLEAQILDKVISLPFDPAHPQGVLTEDLPGEALLAPDREPKDNPYKSSSDPDVELALSNLVRLGCLRFASTYGGGVTSWVVFPTCFGRNFVEACTLQKG